MAAKRRRHRAEIRRLSGLAREANERERAHRARLYKRGRRLARSGKSVALTSFAGLVALALMRKRHDRDDGEADDRHHRYTAQRAGDRKRVRKRDSKDKRVLELARLALTTSRLWESVAARR